MKLERILTATCAFLLLLSLALGLGFWYRHKMMNQVNGHQPMRIMVDGVMYSHRGGIKQEKPDGSPDGTITEIVEPHVYPQKDGQANFGPVGTPYWHYGSKIVVACDKYRIFD